MLLAPMLHKWVQQIQGEILRLFYSVPYYEINMMTREDFIWLFAICIARYEGLYAPGSINVRMRNPGNLRKANGYPIENDYVKFPSFAIGIIYLMDLIGRIIDMDLNTYEFFAGKPNVYPGYAPAKDKNTPIAYANNVAMWMGIDAGKPLKTYMLPPHEILPPKK
jgi:hypothetical protein